MAILSSSTASAPAMVSLDGATQVMGTIYITSVTPGEQPSLTLLGEGPGYSVSNQDGRWTIHLRPTAAQRYPVVYTLTLAPPQGFPLAEPVGQISLLGQEDGFLLDSATLRLFKAEPTLIQPYNLALHFQDEATGQDFWVGDPTIVFEPPS